MRHYHIVFCLFFALAGAAQDLKQKLIVVHVDPAGGNQFKQQIFAYHFLNGTFTGRDELITVQGRKEGKDYIRTDIGRNTLYKNRYLITGIGNIIDLEEKKVLLDQRAVLVRCSNDSAVFFTNDIFKGKYYSVFDFGSGQYGEVKSLTFKALPGRDVEFDKTSSPFRINYYPVGASKITICEDAGYEQSGTKQNHSPDPPLCWLDNDHFVFGRFNRENTELAFYRLTIDSKTSELLGKVAISGAGDVAEMRSFSPGKLLVRMGSRQILVDCKAKTVVELTFTEPDNGFSYECKGSAAGRVIKLDNKEVGKLSFRPVNFTTGKGIAAVVKEISVGTESYQQGLVVWNSVNKTWSQVDADEVLSLVGWINE